MEIDMQIDSLFENRPWAPASVLPLFILLFLAAPPNGAEVWHLNRPAPTVRTDPTRQPDFQSIDGLIKAFYECISFAEGKSPDWDRFRPLFASAATPCIRMTADSVMVMDREGFIGFFGGRIKKGILRSFVENETGRTAELYGNLAQVFSTYEKRMNLDDPGKPIRGINGFQLFFRNGRWWISSVAWQDEIPDRPIPQKYLKRE
jgi:hypothetical protein